MLVKICGITNLDDATQAIKLGANAIGFIFCQSVRQVSSGLAKDIVERTSDSILKVGVFCDHPKEEVERVLDECGLCLAQLHGNEPPDYCQGLGSERVIKSFRVREREDLVKIKEYKEINYILLDTRVDRCLGGTGEVFNWELALEAKKFGKNIILAGGLNPENVAQAIRMVSPYGVDVSSGVESEPGRKDYEKLKGFIQGARNASR